VIGRRGRRRKQLLDDHKETRVYWKLKEEALDRTLWRTRFGRGCGSVVRHCGMNEWTAVPVILQVCENWTLTKPHETRSETAEMKVLRSVAAYALCDHKIIQKTKEEMYTILMKLLYARERNIC
jgi:hypothetical protein